VVFPNSEAQALKNLIAKRQHRPCFGDRPWFIANLTDANFAEPTD
jgi:hypothetical protein